MSMVKTKMEIKIRIIQPELIQEKPYFFAETLKMINLAQHKSNSVWEQEKGYGRNRERGRRRES
jgi:hypothetical protein